MLVMARGLSFPNSQMLDLSVSWWSPPPHQILPWAWTMRPQVRPTRVLPARIHRASWLPPKSEPKSSNRLRGTTSPRALHQAWRIRVTTAAVLVICKRALIKTGGRQTGARFATTKNSNTVPVFPAWAHCKTSSFKPRVWKLELGLRKVAATWKIGGGMLDSELGASCPMTGSGPPLVCTVYGLDPTATWTISHPTFVHALPVATPTFTGWRPDSRITRVTTPTSSFAIKEHTQDSEPKPISVWHGSMGMADAETHDGSSS